MVMAVRDGMLPRRVFLVAGIEYVTFVIGIVTRFVDSVEGCEFVASNVRFDIVGGRRSISRDA